MSEEKEVSMQTMEEAFAELEKTIAKLQDRETPLEEAFELYRSGMALVKDCGRRIDLIEKQVQVINEEGELDDFS